MNRRRDGDLRLDAACARAIEVGDPRYRVVKGILIAGTETGDNAPTGSPLPPALLRGPEGVRHRAHRLNRPRHTHSPCVARRSAQPVTRMSDLV